MHIFRLSKVYSPYIRTEHKKYENRYVVFPNRKTFIRRTMFSVSNMFIRSACRTRESHPVRTTKYVIRLIVWFLFSFFKNI